ncbi:MAG TPA: hypothetical protein VFN19_10320 [Candidatus Nanopelagicales bacterium]|jgi:hypothetical protein|nr:hypothetical protein [Candidatus Nanopelagicales bacterium]
MTGAAARRWWALPPAEAAGLLARDADESWAREFLRQFERAVGEEPELERVMAGWAVSAASVARMFGVSRQAVAKWRAAGQVPADRALTLGDLAAATDVLERYVRPERIAAVVRRPAELLGGGTLLALAESGDSAEVRRQVAAMFDLRRVAP